MSGSSSVSGDESIVYADNLSFDGTSRGGALDTDGQLFIGATSSDRANNGGHVRKGSITSPLATIDIGYDAPNITIDLAGGSIGIDSFNTDVSGPVYPDAAGNIKVTGGQVFSNGTIANTLRLNVEATSNTFLYGQGNNTAMAELGPLTNGQLIIGSTGAAPVVNTLASSDGSVTITNGAGTIDLVVAGGTTVGKTITGDSGPALSPTAGNWNVLGRSGSKTSGTGSTLTVKSPPYADQGGSTTVTLNSGSFATAAITLTLPASGGLSDGDLCEFVATNGVLVIQAAGTQVIHLGSTASSATGTCTSSATGDAISLRYQSSTDDWWATSSIGVWTLA